MLIEARSQKIEDSHLVASVRGDSRFQVPYDWRLGRGSRRVPAKGRSTLCFIELQQVNRKV